MARFRKKPVVIEAVQIEDGLDLSVWPDCRWRFGCVVIETLEGEMVGRVGDWLIKGVANEVYPCKPDIFAATYEAV